MPAAAVIPAPIAYTKVVAVKKLVVGSQFRTGWGGYRTVLRPARLRTASLHAEATPVSAGVLFAECPARPASSP